MFPKTQTLTRQCIYLQSCQFADTSDCIDNILGCMMAQRSSETYKSKKSHKEEAENPEKSRQKF